MGHGSNKYHFTWFLEDSSIWSWKGWGFQFPCWYWLVHGRTLLSVIIRFTRKLNQFFWHFHLNIVMTPWLHTPLGPILWVDGFSQHQKEQLTYFCRFHFYAFIFLLIEIIGKDDGFLKTYIEDNWKLVPEQWNNFYINFLFRS